MTNEEMIEKMKQEGIHPDILHYFENRDKGILFAMGLIEEAFDKHNINVFQAIDTFASMFIGGMMDLGHNKEDILKTVEKSIISGHVAKVEEK